jgi:hypothetical protein
MQNSILLGRHLFGGRYTRLCVALALYATRVLIAGLTLFGKSITN